VKEILLLIVNAWQGFLLSSLHLALFQSQLSEIVYLKILNVLSHLIMPLLSNHFYCELKFFKWINRWVKVKIVMLAQVIYNLRGISKTNICLHASQLAMLSIEVALNQTLQTKNFLIDIKMCKL